MSDRLEEKKLTVREAARQRHPLSGTDAEALEGALVQAERELAGKDREIKNYKQFFDMFPLALETRCKQAEAALESARYEIERQRGLSKKWEEAYQRSERYRAPAEADRDRWKARAEELIRLGKKLKLHCHDVDMEGETGFERDWLAFEAALEEKP